MFTKQPAILLCLLMAVSYLQAQYIPFPLSLKLKKRPPYLNPSVNDPLFYKSYFGKYSSKGLIHCIKGSCNQKYYKEAASKLGSNILYDSHRNIYINKTTGDYYDPKTGLIYRKSYAKHKKLIDGHVGANPPSSKDSPYKKADKVYFPKRLRGHNWDRCKNCKKSQYNNRCSGCYKYKDKESETYDEMGYSIVMFLNKYRRMNNRDIVRFNKKISSVARTNNRYMVHRGYLSDDNFLANIAKYEAGNQTTGYINASSLSDMTGAKKFIKMWINSPKHNKNLLSTRVNQCGADVYFEKEAQKYYATLICIKI